MADRYKVHNTEGEFEPGSNGQVLRNMVGITSSDDMDELELHLLAQLYDEVLIQNLPNRRLTTADLRTWHRQWLGNVYQWAGQDRTVNMSKGGFPFAAAGQVSRLMQVFEQTHLTSFTPCHGLNEQELSLAIATAHVEFIIVHPFREGNGRLSRLLADVMAVQAGEDPLDYSTWETHKDGYISAIHQGFSGNYTPMQHWVLRAMGLSIPDLNGPV